MQPVYRRILLKLSGEALAGQKDSGFCIDGEVLMPLCKSIARMTEMGVEVAVVCGGGNIWRGRAVPEMERTRADQAGMLATVINALALQDGLIRSGVEAELFTAFEMGPVSCRFRRPDADRVLRTGGVALLAGGTGSPFFSTDTAAALRAAELSVDAILMAKTIDGVYTADPRRDPTAVLVPEITASEALSCRLGVMDAAAMAICMDNHISIRVFAMDPLENLIRVVCGEGLGSTVTA